MRALLAALLALCLAAAAPSVAAQAEPLDPPGTRTLVLVRHGHYDQDPSADPRLGPHLSPLGVAQAHLVGARLGALRRFDGVHVSPLQRARDTAAVIAQDLPGRQFSVDEDLAECTPPSREARAMAGETAAGLAACKAQLERVFARYFQPSAHGDRSDLFVCHGNVIRYLVARSLGLAPDAWLSMSIGHASITRIRIAPDGHMQVIAVGDVGHLPPNLMTGASGDAERSLAIPAGG